MATDPAPTQVRRPWRALVRTGAVVLVALLPMIPDIVAAADIGDIPGVALVVAIAVAAQRILSTPTVEIFLNRYAPWLAADPYTGTHRKGKKR